MDMNRGRDAVRDVVELRYRPEVADLTSALRARLRVSRAGWVQWWSPVAVGLIVVGEVLAVASGADSLSPGLLAGAAAVAVIVPLAPWLQARAFMRLAERQGEFRVTVTEEGVSVVTEHTTASVDWAAQPRYRETPRVFVLLSDDKNATGFTMLPKSGLADAADEGRLREILDRHLTRC
ncbi:YcxB family protein [Streptomyces sp. LP11]|uniref:YcxB family protein n=1 Tax=Streptomyces pyxinicus TaxID=2970331 RepID=A0ABT2AZ56_9ACTN|nr:YcxB family protein [Streptomyces sp. LP11]MCS0601430.1 YcxB family protein [Streptomyces sp. LP11]